MRSLLPLLTSSFLLSSFLATSHAIDLVDDFDGIGLNAAVWEKTQPKTLTVDAGILTWAADQGNWASGDIATQQRFFVPPAGETTTIEWTMAPPVIVTQNVSGDSSVRFQIGVLSGDSSVPNREHWVNTTGGLWLDMDNIVQANAASISGFVRYANDTKAASTQGSEVAGVTVDWDWQNVNQLFRLEITETGFTWSTDDATVGKIVLGTETFATASIDTEFTNGFRVLALGMNFDAGRGSISVDKIEVMNAFGPTSIITSFSGVRANPVANEFVDLSWVVDPDASVSIDQGLGNVDASTVGGIGTIRVAAPNVTEATAVQYILTATKDADTVTRAFTLNVTPAPELFLENMSDHFDGSELDPANWVQQGNKTHSVANSLVTWAADTGTWTTGEVASVPVFPFPEPGKPTTVRWTLGPASVTTAGADPVGRDLRAQMGIVSSFERNTFSIQHYSNVTGGVWLDVEEWGTVNVAGVAGQFYTANDTKALNANGTATGNFVVSDWTWATEPHEFSITMTDTGYTWFSGEEQIGLGQWADADLDHEFVNGFRIMGMAGNWSTGSGPISYDLIEVENGALLGPPFLIRSFSYDADAKEITLSWNSKPDKEYSLGVATSLEGVWFEERDDLVSQGDITTATISTESFFLFLNGAPDRAFMRISENEQAGD